MATAGPCPEETGRLRGLRSGLPDGVGAGTEFERGVAMFRVAQERAKRLSTGDRMLSRGYRAGLRERSNRGKPRETLLPSGPNRGSVRRIRPSRDAGCAEHALSPDGAQGTVPAGLDRR